MSVTLGKVSAEGSFLYLNIPLRSVKVLKAPLLRSSLSVTCFTTLVDIHSLDSWPKIGFIIVAVFLAVVLVICLFGKTFSLGPSLRFHTIDAVARVCTYLRTRMHTHRGCKEKSPFYYFGVNLGSTTHSISRSFYCSPSVSRGVQSLQSSKSLFKYRKGSSLENLQMW